VYEICFFDLDGTLTQSEFGVGASIRGALKHFGVPEPDDQELRRYIGPPLMHSLRHYAGLTGEQIGEAIEIYRSLYNTKGYQDAPLYPGIPEALDRLKAAGKTLAVVTSKPEGIARKVLEYQGLFRWFTDLFGPDDSERESGKEELIRKAIRHYGLSDGRRAVMIGDRKYDILGAKGAGIDSIGVLYGYGSREELIEAGATWIAERPEELPDRVEHG